MGCHKVEIEENGDSPVIMIFDKFLSLSKDYERTGWGSVSPALMGHVFRHSRLQLGISHTGAK